MSSSSSHFMLTIEPRVPDFEAERLFAVNEYHYAERALAELKKRKGLFKLLAPVVGEQRPEDWHRYITELQHYLAQVDQHEDEVMAGVVPVKFFIENTGEADDEAVMISVSIKNGTVHPNKRPPERPLRIDGPQHVPEWKPSPAPLTAPLKGFARTDIKVTDELVAAKFSELAAHDSADLVHQVLYVEGTEDTRFEWEITSKHSKHPAKGIIHF